MHRRACGSRPLHLPFFALAACAVLTAPAARAQTGIVRGEAPIREVVLSDGARRYGVPITIGATPIEAGLDSGSAGLRVVPGTLQPSDAKAGGRAGAISYGAGAKLDGPIGQAVVSVGEVSGRIGLQLISKVGCVPEQPRCAAGRIPVSAYGIEGDGLPGEGFKAILGINTAPSDAPSVLPALGVRRWIVELPRPGESSPGRLVLNPTDDEVAGYTRLSRSSRFVIARGGLHDAVEGCLENVQTRQRLCGAVLMDTGAPGVTVEADGTGPLWKPDTPALLSLSREGKVAAAARFLIDRRSQASRLTFRAGHGSHGEGGGPTVIYAGLLPYFVWSVLYEPGRDVIAVKARAPLPDGPTAIPVPKS